jgi:hypothetical protein
VGLLPTFGPPDVDDAHLLVEGVDRGEQGWSAVAAVDFRLDDAVRDATLTLVASAIVDGSAVPAACAVLAPFTPVAGGPWSDVPEHLCTGAVTAEVLGGNRFVFRDVDRLAQGVTVRLLIVPGGVGRIVFNRPGAAALDTGSPSTPSTAPAVDVPTPAASFDEDVALTPVSPVPDSATVGAVPLDPTATAPARSAPVAAGPQFEPAADDFGTRLATAAVLTLLLCAFTVMQRGGNTRLRPARVRWRGAGR